jgi:GntR family transcriptional repressor for pyruvate dehydrogenase complex
MNETAEKFPRIKATPAYQLVAEAIERQILSGRMRPGEPIGTEAALVKQFGVNRSTVREGIRLLEQGGLIQRDSSRRLSVGFPHVERLATRMSRAMVLTEVTFRELYEAAMVLQIGIAEAAAERITPELLAELDANIALTAKSAGDPQAVTELDAEFHMLIGKASQNRVLQLAREPTHMLIFPTTGLILRKVGIATSRLIQAHRMIVDGLRRGDKEACRTWVRRHLNDWRKGFEHTGHALDEPIDGAYAQERAAREDGTAG